jgi:Tfp pilus assembly protein PilO
VENSLLKTLIVVILAYYLIKGLIYLLLWQTTYKVQQKMLETKKKTKEENLKKRKERLKEIREQREKDE